MREAFAAGHGSWILFLLELIVHRLIASGGFSSSGDVAAVQWWKFVNSNFAVISKDIAAFDAVAQQWDVRGVVCESVFGRMKEAQEQAFTRESTVVKAAAAATAAANDSRAVFRNPLRHIFPSVSYHQRTRLTFTRAASRISTIRCACCCCHRCIFF
jgi:hypothetical protein